MNGSEGRNPKRTWTPRPDAEQPAAAAAAVLRAAAAAADGHAPLLAPVRLLAERARIPLQPSAAGVTEAPALAQAREPYGLTGRELAVLRLLAAGRSNAQIGAELYISPARPACTSAASCASSGSPAGSRPPPSPNAPACCAPGRPKHPPPGI